MYGIFGVFTVKCTQILLHSAQEDEEQQLQKVHDEVKHLRREIIELKGLLLNVQNTPHLNRSDVDRPDPQNPTLRDQDILHLGERSTHQSYGEDPAEQKSVEKEGGEKDDGNAI